MARHKFSSLQLLVLATAFAAICAIAAPVLYEAFGPQKSMLIDLADQPKMGNAKAPVEVVVFEDFQCATCQFFTQELFPKIRDQYVATGKALYVFIPVAYIEGSKPLANAALAVNKQSPEKFFAYAHAIFSTPHRLDGAALVALAEKVGGIDLAALKSAIETNRHYAELDRNYHRAIELMGRQFGTPALFINGVRTPPMSYRAIKAQIETAEKSK